ncbi:MAG: hypothetical protein ACK501_06260, partial [Planctomycetota bacterium]
RQPSPILRGRECDSRTANAQTNVADFQVNPLATNRIATPLVAAVARNEHQLIATDGQQLLQLETKTLTVVAKLPMPPWFPRVDQMVLSADGNRLAIACGSDVRILTIE